MQQCFLNFLVCASLLFGGCKTRYEEIPPDLPKTLTVLGTMDTQWRIRSLDGSEMPLSRFEGKKLFVNIWATWCGPCRAELPHLQTLYDSMRADTNIVFLFISDEPDTTVRSFVASSNYSLPFYLCDKSKPTIFDTGSYPSTFIINAAGEIVYRKVGTAKWSHASVIDFLEKL